MARTSTPTVYVSPGADPRVPARTVGEFGVLKLSAGSTNLTNFRGVPTQVLGWGSVDPGGHDAATFSFPQITIDDLGDLGSGDLDWYNDGVVMRLDHVLGGVVANLWRGRAHAINVRDARVTIECDGDLIGPMSWATYRPSIDRQVEDIGWSICKQIPLSSHVSIDPDPTTIGIEMERTGSRTDTRWAWATSTLALAQTRDGVQWTVLPSSDPGVYTLGHRNLTTHHATVHLGMPGVDADLLRDILSKPTRYYGEGQRADGGRWYGAVFPYLDITTIPAFPNAGGAPIVLGDTNADTGTGDGITILFRTLGRYGLSYDDTRAVFTKVMQDAVEEVQDQAGLPITGQVNVATWDAIFSPATVGSLYGAHYEPLVERSAVRAFDKTPSGLILGDNADYNPEVPVVDSFVGFGAGVDKSTARQWCRTQMQADFAQPEWSGTVTLTTDPAEMSRFALRAGMNLWDPGFGAGTVFHIASVAVDWTSGSVSCDVSTRGRDYLDLSSILERNRAARTSPGKRFASQLSRRSAVNQDMRPGWDYEGGAGIVTETAASAGGWTVIPVFVGQAGSIGEVHLRTHDSQTEYAVAIFARSVTAAHLDSIAGDPLATRLDDGSWTTDPAAIDEMYGLNGATADDAAQVVISGRLTSGKLLVYAAGTPTTPTDAPLPCGYWPSTDAGKPDNDTLGTNLTGEWKDDSAFDYFTYDGPFLYVAVWPRNSTIFHGRLYPSMTEGGM